MTKRGIPRLRLLRNPRRLPPRIRVPASRLRSLRRSRSPLRSRRNPPKSRRLRLSRPLSPRPSRLQPPNLRRSRRHRRPNPRHLRLSRRHRRPSPHPSPRRYPRLSRLLSPRRYPRPSPHRNRPKGTRISSGLRIWNRGARGRTYPQKRNVSMHRKDFQAPILRCLEVLFGDFQGMHRGIGCLFGK